MSGKAQRRREKLVKAANQGNLAKAQRGKASANLPLPNAPTKEDYVEKIPASLRKMMALKAAADMPKPKRRKLDPAQQQLGTKHQQQQLAQQQQTQQRGQSQEQQLNDSQQQQQHSINKQHAGTAGPGAAATPAEVTAPKLQPGLIWEQPKKLKQRKKEYLNAKKLKKKGKKPQIADEHLSVDRPAFGEVVHEPPKVHLKRKHWDPAAAANAQQQQQPQPRQKQKQQPKPSLKQRQDPVMLELREQVIEGYRAGRGPREGQATLNSLKQLVR